MSDQRPDVSYPIKPVFIVALIVSAVLTAALWLLDPLLNAFPHLPDQGPAWYFWKLPQATLWGTVTAWGGYVLHQLTAWYFVRKLGREKGQGGAASRTNIAFLLVNLGFILLHLLQTQLFYDGLAQQVPVWSSQYSVIGMLFLILILAIPARGIFWGAKVKVPGRVMAFVRKYHGYYIAWALVYTFWFHPMEGDPAILTGFFYMFLLLIQLSMAGTRLHTNMKWIVLLELMVGLHGPMIAIMNGQAAWPMFLFGFLFMFVMTQMHGLKLPLWSRFVVLALYLGGAAWAYSVRGFGRLYEISFIPVALYAGVFGIIGLGALAFWIGDRVKGKGPGSIAGGPA